MDTSDHFLGYRYALQEAVQVRMKWVANQKSVVVEGRTERDQNGASQYGASPSSNLLWVILTDCNYEKLYKKVLINPVIQSNPR
jgi:hypothetical protein